MMKINRLKIHAFPPFSSIGRFVSKIWKSVILPANHACVCLPLLAWNTIVNISTNDWKWKVYSNICVKIYSKEYFWMLFLLCCFSTDHYGGIFCQNTAKNLLSLGLMKPTKQDMHLKTAQTHFPYKGPKNCAMGTVHKVCNCVKCAWWHRIKLAFTW